jgi:hypothetical protein
MGGVLGVLTAQAAATREVTASNNRPACSHSSLKSRAGQGEALEPSPRPSIMHAHEFLGTVLKRLRASEWTLGTTKKHSKWTAQR